MDSPHPPTDELGAQLLVLANPRRRLALALLEASETPVTVRDIAHEIATREHDEPLPEIPSETVTRIYSSLYHVHVPKLEEAGVIEYDVDRRRIDDVALDSLRPILETVSDVERQSDRIE